MKRPRPRRWLVLVPALSVCLLLAACGEDDAEEAADQLRGADQASQAADAQAMIAARIAQGALETYGVENNGSYAGVTPAIVSSLDPSAAEGLTVQGTPTGYQLTVASDSGNTFTISKDASGVVNSCEAPGVGGCPQSGRW
jgi:hypothetical protein